MSRKDYVAIADAIRKERESWDVSSGSAEAFLALHNVTRNVADVLATDNPNFDRERFLKAALG